MSIRLFPKAARVDRFEDSERTILLLGRSDHRFLGRSLLAHVLDRGLDADCTAAILAQHVLG